MTTGASVDTPLILAEAPTAIVLLLGLLIFKTAPLPRPFESPSHVRWFGVSPVEGDETLALLRSVRTVRRTPRSAEPSARAREWSVFSIDVHFVLCNSGVSSPIWAIDRSNALELVSCGSSETLSIVTKASRPVSTPFSPRQRKSRESLALQVVVGVLGEFALKLPRKDTVRAALLLAGGGEFAFVVLTLAERVGVLPGPLAFAAASNRQYVWSFSNFERVWSAAFFPQDFLRTLDTKH